MDALENQLLLDTLCCCVVQRVSRALRRYLSFLSSTEMSSRDVEWMDVYDPLLPIRVHIEQPGGKLMLESFFFNAEEPDVSPVSLAQMICRERGLAVQTWLIPIAECIAQQIEHYSQVVSLRIPRGLSMVDVRITVRMNDYLMEDRFEWDLLNPFPAVDEFADICARDYKLDSWWAFAIAFQMRERLFDIKRIIREHMFRPHGGVRNLHTVASLPVFLPLYITGDAKLYEYIMQRSTEDAERWSLNIESLSERDVRKWEADLLREERVRRRRPDAPYSPPLIVVDPESPIPKIVPNPAGLWFRIDGDRVSTTQHTDVGSLAPPDVGLPQNVQIQHQHQHLAHVAPPNGLYGLSSGIPASSMTMPFKEDYLYANSLLQHGHQVVSAVGSTAQGNRVVPSVPPAKLIQRYLEAVHKYHREHPKLPFHEAIAEFSRRLRAMQIQWSDYSEHECPIRL